MKKIDKIIFAILIVFFLSVNLYLAKTDAQTIDEGPHLAAGYSYWKTGDFRLNPEHPPLVKLLASLPLLFLGPDLPLDHESWADYNQWEFSRQFFYHNSISADTILFLGRLPVILLGLLLGLFIFKWSKEIFGVRAGLLALFLYALSPNFIAHSHLITTDVPLALFFLLSIYYFGKYLKNPISKNLIISSLVFALAILTKYSALLLIPILVFILILRRWLYQKKIFSFKKFIIIFLVFLGVSASMTIIFYGFQFQKPYSDPRVVRLYEERQEIIDLGQTREQPGFVKPLIKYGDPNTRIGSFLFNFANNFPVPAYSYWRGLFSVLTHNFWGHGSYLFGMHGTNGWWYYFIVAFLFKTPITTITLLLVAIYLSFYLLRKNSLRNKSFLKSLEEIRFDLFLITIPPLIYFLWSLTSHINLGVRHIFPSYPFIFIFVSLVVKFWLKNRSIKNLRVIIFSLLIILYIFTNLNIFPFYLSYFNEAVGGPGMGTKYLIDSNLDWGQDYKRFKKYVEKNNIDRFYLAYFGSLETKYYLKNEMPMLTTEQAKLNIKKGYYVISVGALLDRRETFSWLKDFEPYEKIGYSIYIYKF